MNKMKKRCIALLVVFTSIISFLPVGFIGKVANAATIGTDATEIQLNVTGSKTALIARTDTSTSEQIYTTTTVTDSFDLTLKDVMTTTADLEESALLNNKSTSGITNQQIDIVSINGTSNETTEGKAILNDIGITIGTAENLPGATTKRIGKKIGNLPLGVNKIEYKITITTQDITYTPAASVLNADGVTYTNTDEKITTKNPVDTSYANQKITIEHATTFAVNKISPMTFKAYVGQASSFNDNDEIEDSTLNTNNAVPFLYSTEAEPDTNIALRYTFDVPDSISTLKYVMTFESTMNLDGARVYKNGKEAVEGSEYNIDGQELTGSLARLGQSDLIVVKLNSSNSTEDIQKAYAIEIRYNNLSSDKDYSLKDAGLTKLDYNDDDNVKAYVGKKFTVTKNSAGFPVYDGNIYIDSKAKMISVDPTLIRSKSTVAYVVTNNYVDSSGITQVKKSVLKDGKQFVDFMASTTSNEIQVDVYEGADGSVTDSSIPLARYCLKVNTNTENEFVMGLGFSSSVDPYLRQPGVKDNIIDFTTARRTYDLCFGDPDVDPIEESVTVTLNGTRSTNNEYIKVWLADDVNSSNLKEAEGSVNNDYNDNSSDEEYLKRNTSVDVTLGTAKKMVVQAYYDDFETMTVTENGISVEKDVLVASYPVGEKYVFYLPNNYDKSDGPTAGETSDNASLSSVKLKGYTLQDSDGNEGFSSDKFDYTSTVEKEDTTAKITVIPEDDNIQSIVATIDGGEESYDLVSGELSELPLSESGKTTIEIVVTAQDGTTQKTYTIVIKNNTKSSNVNLKNVILNVGDYTFDSTNDVTKVRVDQNVTSIKVTPIAEDSKSTVSVNGEEYLETQISVSLKGAQKTTVSIEVVSEDGTASKTYTLEIYRVNAADWDSDSNNDDDATEDDQYYDEYNECWVDLTKYEEWGSVNGKPTYFNNKNRQVKEAWISTGGKYYYLNNLGYRASGWKIDDANGKTYYLDSTTGEMKKQWMNVDNSWYYLGLNGVMQKGWLSLNNKWYYFTPNGKMVINQSMFVDDKVYNFGQDGAIY